MDREVTDGSPDGTAGRLVFSGGRRDEDLPGFWVLARLGKRVLRPGGLELTRTLLGHADVTGADVVELAPGVGRTAREIAARRPRSYTGVERDGDAAGTVHAIVADQGRVMTGDASRTGLSASSADVVVGEAVLTMQSSHDKEAIVAEAVRVLRPGGRYGIHELALTPDDLPDHVTARVRRTLAQAIKVNARPLTVAEWTSLLQDQGLVVEHVQTAPMALLQPRRILADEGILGALRFAKNLLTHPRARRRVIAIRRTFRSNRNHLIAVAITARRPETSTVPS